MAAFQVALCALAVFAFIQISSGCAGLGYNYGCCSDPYIVDIDCFCAPTCCCDYNYGYGGFPGYYGSFPDCYGGFYGGYPYDCFDCCYYDDFPYGGSPGYYGSFPDCYGGFYGGYPYDCFDCCCYDGFPYGDFPGYYSGFPDYYGGYPNDCCECCCKPYTEYTTVSCCPVVDTYVVPGCPYDYFGGCPYGGGFYDGFYGGCPYGGCPIY